jgi:hypothetical protein
MFWLALISSSSTCGSQALDHPMHHRLATQFLQALVDAAHAAAEAAGQHDAGDFRSLIAP